MTRSAIEIPKDRLPILDMSRSAEDFACALDTACEEIGFFYLTNHGVPEELLRRVFGQAARFHAEPLQKKAALAINAFHRGYIGASSYRHNDTLAPNLSESLVIMHELPPDHPDVLAERALQGPNQWPELAGFRDTMLAYVSAMEEVGRTLLARFAVALELDRDHFEPSFREPTTFLRLLRYPPQAKASAETQFGSAPHTDYGAITLLAQDDSGGLHVRNRSGDWIAATPIPGAFIVNIGDVMARWTNDRYVSTEHRVINSAGGHRYSVPFFFDPHMDVEIACLATCASTERPPKYDAIRYGDYLLGRLNAHYAYRNAGASL